MKRTLLISLLGLMLATVSSAQEVPNVLPDAPVAKVGQTPPSVGPKFSNDPFWDNHRPSDKHFWLINSEAYASTAAPLLGGLRCRRTGPEGCSENYGAFYLSWGLTSVIEVAAGTGVYHMCRKDNHNSKKCDIIQHIVTGINIGWGVHEALIVGKR